MRLEEHMKLAHLQQLMKEFSQHRPEDIVVQQGSGYFPPKLMKRTPGCMNLVEFQTTIAKVLGTSEYSEYLEKLFVKVRTRQLSWLAPGLTRVVCCWVCFFFSPLQ